MRRTAARLQLSKSAPISASEADERTAFLKNYALFLALRHKKENALALLTKAVQEKAIKEGEATELRELITD